MSARYSFISRITNNGYFYVLPAVFYIGILGAYPLFRVIRLSFQRSNLFTLAPQAVGLENYARVLQDPTFWLGLRHSLVYVTANTLLHIGIGLAVALLLNQAVGRRFIAIGRSLSLLPWTITPVVVAGLWRLIYHPDLSLVPTILRALGISSEWNILGVPETALTGVIVANVWNFTPFYMLMLLARLQAIPEDMYEAAGIDGATGWQMFRFLTLPQLRETMAFLALFDVIGTFTQFELIWVTTRGGPLQSTEVLSTYVYRQAFESFDFGYSSAVAVTMCLVMAIFAATVYWVGNRGVD